IQYLTKLRIEQSIVLLRETDATIDQIARSIGFTNGSYFSKVFREWVGCPPGEFRVARVHLSFSQMFFN
ncbi:MAG: helix-turn-helix transcriptional regulator, partial [Gorillibacterium sp.]|nr:helix-turn-helix transcriptional regulator [Gorillibacterium sp.]